jgi:eukaryotic-like serine/threonine-protein kinase
VHRDLKPENVFITADDRVKILDFGLARQDIAPGEPATTTPTVTSATEPGTVLGTVGYMAPEQVRATNVDWRADIFSFGAVLYEMITGSRAFQRDTAAETMTAILREDPPEPTRSMSPAVDRIVRHCLEKKPEARFRSAHDLAFALDAVAGATSSLTSAAETIGPRRPSRWLFVATAVAAAVVAGAATGWSIGRRSTVTPGSAPSQPARFQQLTFNRGVVTGARFAADGKTIVYSAGWNGGEPRLFLTRLEFPGATALPLPTAVLFAVSSDAELAVGLNPIQRSGTLPVVATLARSPMLGGAPTTLLEGVIFADWSPTGGQLAVVRLAGSRQRLEYPLGTVLFETEGEIGDPRVSPDGTRVAFLDWPVKHDDRGSVAIADRSGAKRTVSRSWEAVRGLAWRPDGREVWYTAASAGTVYSLWASASTPADERPVFAAPGGLVLQDIAEDGRTIVKRFDRSFHIEGAFDGGESREMSWLDFQFVRDLSRDGRRMLLTHAGHGSSQNYDVYIRGTRDNETARLGEGQAQQFSPDGKSVLSVVHGPPAKLLILPVGAGETREVATSGVTVANARWLGDGGTLLLIGAEGTKPSRAYVMETAGGTPQPITPAGITYSAEQVALSPDGGRVALRAPDGAITIYSTRGDAPRVANGFAAGEMPTSWTADGRSLVLVEQRPQRRLVAVDPITGARSTLMTLKPSDPSLNGPTQVVLAADRRSYVANYGRRHDTLYLVEGLK